MTRHLIVALAMVLWAAPASADKHDEVVVGGGADCNGGRVHWRDDDTAIHYTPADNSAPVRVYNGNQKVHMAVECPSGGIVTQFSGNWIYYSPNCLNVGGGGKTERVYSGRQKIVRWTSHVHRGVEGLWTEFSGGGIYFSPDCRNIGGGRGTVRLN